VKAGHQRRLAGVGGGVSHHQVSRPIAKSVALFVVHGVFYSIDEVQGKAFIADIELERRASAIGVYNFVTGLIYLPASLIAGALCVMHPVSAFVLVASLALAVLAAIVILRPDLRRGSSAGSRKLRRLVLEEPRVAFRAADGNGCAPCIANGQWTTLDNSHRSPEWRSVSVFRGQCVDKGAILIMGLLQMLIPEEAGAA
jgi:MFS family permease